MIFDDLKKFAEKGKLIIHKYSRGQYKRAQYIYGKKHTSEDINKDEFYKLQKVKYHTYTRYYYSCRTTQMETHKGFKITAKDYAELEKAGAKVEI